MGLDGRLVGSVAGACILGAVLYSLSLGWQPGLRQDDVLAGESPGVPCDCPEQRELGHKHRPVSLPPRPLRLFPPAVKFQRLPSPLSNSPFFSEQEQQPHPAGGDTEHTRPGGWSRFRCVGNDNLDAAADRTCEFEGICYTAARRWEFYLPPGAPEHDPLFFNASGQLESFPARLVSVVPGEEELDWAPNIVRGPMPTGMQLRRGTTMLFASDVRDCNFGHMVWNDLAALFQAQTMLSGALDPNTNAVDMRSRRFAVRNRAKAQCALWEQQYLPIIAPKGLEHPKTLRDTCFERVVTGYRGMDAVYGGYKPGRVDTLARFRDFLLRHFGLDPTFQPDRHKIIVTDKDESIYAHRGAKHRAIENVGEVVTFLRGAYPGIEVERVAWEKLTVAEEMAKLLNTTLLITPAGGVSYNLPYLPNGAAAIVMDYLALHDEAKHGVHTGESVSMDDSLFSGIRHVRRLFYQVHAKDDFHFDFQGASDTRNDASIVVKMDRLKLLVDSAFAHM